MSVCVRMLASVRAFVHMCVRGCLSFASPVVLVYATMLKTLMNAVVPIC